MNRPSWVEEYKGQTFINLDQLKAKRSQVRQKGDASWESPNPEDRNIWSIMSELAQAKHKEMGRGAVLVSSEGHYEYFALDQIEAFFEKTPLFNKVHQLLATYDPEKFYVVGVQSLKGNEWMEVQLMD